ncbi:MAG: 50S ribosomal protein L17 [Candidatus Pacebacteria bacterium]|nr:50S ribosomal protein L17 [Candidatus Paceibacterota bacterium]
MRHRVSKKTFNRSTKHRQAMFKNMVRSLVLHGQIKTTQAKAKEIGRIADKLISTAKKGDLAARRQLHRFFGKRDIVNTLVDRVAPLMKDRQSGFTTIKMIGKRRGDNSLMVQLSLVEQSDQTGSLSNPEKKESK